MDSQVLNHVLQRTSPLGELFIGKCIRCNAEDLRMAQANEPCPNTNNLSDDAIIERIFEGDASSAT
jgi:hypothetical protein